MRQSIPNVPVEYVERDRLMPIRGTLSIARARALLGYAPRYPIERGVPEYISWYRNLYQQTPSLTSA